MCLPCVAGRFAGKEGNFNVLPDNQHLSSHCLFYLHSDAPFRRQREQAGCLVRSGQAFDEGTFPMSIPRVLISDKMSPLAAEKFKQKGIEVDVITDLDPLALEKVIGAYEGLAIRSATKVTDKIIAAAEKLKVVGRAGIGVDNVDLKAASAHGVIVMNTPFGNSVTTAEHAISMMLSLARQIPLANSSTQAGKWEKSRFMGVEVTGKTFGVIGCGNIGKNAVKRAQGLQMHAIAFDPYLTEEVAQEIGVRKVTLNELLAEADFISLHTPMVKEGAHVTYRIINAEALARMKPSAYLINCARGGLVDEESLKTALENGQLAGAALDVFEKEPAQDNPLFGMENVVCTPHLGASTTEAQDNVAVQVAEQMADYLLSGTINNAVNFASISAEEAQKIKPYLELAQQLGTFIGQIADEGFRAIDIEYVGELAESNLKALTSVALEGILKPMCSTVNMVNAQSVAAERGIQVGETTRGKEGTYGSFMRITAQTENEGRRIVAGTVFANGRPKIIQLRNIEMEGELGGHMLYTINSDEPGYIGAIGNLLGEAGINIASFHLGRADGEAVALIELDMPMPAEVMEKINALPQVSFARSLRI